MAFLFHKKATWKTLFLGQAGNIDSEWRIYLHILECHGADMYEKFGNLHPWANEAGEHLHALDRMFFFQRSRKGTQQGLAKKILTTGMRVRWSHNQLRHYQTNLDIPTDVKRAKPLLNRTSTVHHFRLTDFS
jgi:hypothetical protein